MSRMIQKFQLNLNINLTKKSVLKNTYPFGRSSDDRHTNTQGLYMENLNDQKM